MRERADGLRVDPNPGQEQKKMRFSADSSSIKGKLTTLGISRESGSFPRGIVLPQRKILLPFWPSCLTPKPVCFMTAPSGVSTPDMDLRMWRNW
jgi:hypothetical protein